MKVNGFFFLEIADMGVRILECGLETLRSANGLNGLNAFNHLNGYLFFKSAAPESPVRRSGR